MSLVEHHIQIHIEKGKSGKSEIGSYCREWQTAESLAQVDFEQFVAVAVAVAPAAAAWLDDPGQT